MAAVSAVRGHPGASGHLKALFTEDQSRALTPLPGGDTATRSVCWPSWTTNRLPVTRRTAGVFSLARSIGVTAWGHVMDTGLTSEGRPAMDRA